MSSIKAHCNVCSGEKNHEVLHKEKTYWDDYECGMEGNDTYETLKCMGCESIKLRHVSLFVYQGEEPEKTINYFPPKIFRQQPNWINQIWIFDHFVKTLIKEIYIALQNNLPNLAAMGVRSLIEKVMIDKVGDNGTFKQNIAKFEELGYVSKFQREHLEAILDAGHATIHRSYSPTTEDVITLIDITEHIIKTIYLHKNKIEQLKTRVPSREPKKKD
ncbi:MAG TPA: DUF4145 domain-containing protein [Methylobacter sp.]|jgi:hypothetical protein